MPFPSGALSRTQVTSLQVDGLSEISPLSLSVKFLSGHVTEPQWSTLIIF